MACGAVETGSRFLAATLANLDCQGRSIGAYGYGALADPASPIAQALTAILTIFIALFGIRLLLGPFCGPRSLVDDAIRVGLFLALATSWPAWRVVAYALVLDGPTELASAIGRPAGLPGAAGDLTARLQDADDGIVALTTFGSGRLTGGVSAGSDLGDSASGIALADQTALGSGRATFLATVIGITGLLRIGAGLLLALAPLMAGLLLFTGTRAIFMGWLRGLGFCALGSLAFSVTAGVELALLYPWLTNTLAQRDSNVLTPSAPTELFVLTIAFAFATAGILLLLARVMFFPANGLSNRDYKQAFAAPLPAGLFVAPRVADLAPVENRRAQVLVAAVEGSLRRESDVGPAPRSASVPRERAGASDIAPPSDCRPLIGEGRLGETWRRTGQRNSLASQRRDRA